MEGNELYEVNAALFDCIDHMRGRFDALSDPLADGSAEIMRRQQRSERIAYTELFAQALMSYCVAIRI